MKRLMILFLAILLLIGLCSCKKKILTCDSCGKEVEVDEDSNMDEEWTIYCKECNEKLFSDGPVEKYEDPFDSSNAKDGVNG